MNYFIKAMVGILCVLLALGIFTLSAFLYNYRFHPLARLARSIETNDDIHMIRKTMMEYKNNNDNNILQYTDNYPDKTCDPKRRTVVHGCLFLYDKSIFDDVQLSVFFNEDSKVIDYLYVAD